MPTYTRMVSKNIGDAGTSATLDAPWLTSHKHAPSHLCFHVEPYGERMGPALTLSTLQLRSLGGAEYVALGSVRCSLFQCRPSNILSLSLSVLLFIIIVMLLLLHRVT